MATGSDIWVKVGADKRKEMLRFFMLQEFSKKWRNELNKINFGILMGV